MKINTLFIVTAVLMLFFGAGFVLLPVQVFGMYGVTLDASGIMLGHVAGAAVFALGALAVLFRNNKDTQTNRLAAIALGTFFLIKTIVTVLAQLDGVFNSLGLSIILIDVVMLLAYGYFLFVDKSWLQQTT